MNVRKTQYLKKKLAERTGWKVLFPGAVYNEFVMQCPDPGAVNKKLQDNGIIGGYELEKDYPELKNTLLLCATEMLSKDDLDLIVSIAAQ